MPLLWAWQVQLPVGLENDVSKTVILSPGGTALSCHMLFDAPECQKGKLAFAELFPSELVAFRVDVRCLA